MEYGVVEIDVLLGVVDCFQEVVQDAVGLVEDVEQDALVALRRLVVVAVIVQIVPRVKQLLDLKLALLREADLVLDDTCALHDDVMVERAVADVHLVGITAQVVEFVYVYSVA